MFKWIIPVTPNLTNINSASQSELATLPGIGPVKAKAIVAYRDVHGPFSDLNDLLKVGGVGPNAIDLFRPFSRV